MSFVVNCFHFSVSLGYKTTNQKYIYHYQRLWIAFIFQYLWDTKQLIIQFIRWVDSCELLSFFSIFGIQNNNSSQDSAISAVVNCFHFSVSLGYKTTNHTANNGCVLLWIAFIFQYLWDTKQLAKAMGKDVDSCELLSFFSIFGIQNNNTRVFSGGKFVVNCFHFSVSLGYKTTGIWKDKRSVELWIALATPNRLAFPLLDFIFQYLWDTKQLLWLDYTLAERCELLSFFSIFGIQNNDNVTGGYDLVLWIAFIFQYLWDTKQLHKLTVQRRTCCELLSFFSIFGIQNNIILKEPGQTTVVNCFHFSVSLGYKTTTKWIILF